MLVSLTWCFCLTSVFIGGTAMFISAKETSLTATEYWHNRTKRNEVLCMYSEVFPLYRISDLSRIGILWYSKRNCIEDIYYTTARGNVVSSGQSNILRTRGCKLSDFNVVFNTRKVQFISSRHHVIFFALYRRFVRLHKHARKSYKIWYSGIVCSFLWNFDWCTLR